MLQLEHIEAIDKRGVREGLYDQVLTIFGLLQKPVLLPAATKRIRAVADESLTMRKAE